MPTLFAGYHGPAAWMAVYAISIFFVLRAAGRFIGSWLLIEIELGGSRGSIQFRDSCLLYGEHDWRSSDLRCFLLPFSGIFMSVIYPTDQFQRHQLLPKGRTRRRLWGNLVFHLCVSRGWTSGHGRYQ